MANCYENGVGVYRSRNNARRCREAAERRETLDMAAEALFNENGKADKKTFEEAL